MNTYRTGTSWRCPEVKSDRAAALPPILNGEDAPFVEAERAGADAGDASARCGCLGSRL